jgi:uncharacterized protein YycO
MAPTTSRRRLAAVTGLAGVAALAVPAMASASATAPSLTAAQQRQIAAADQRTTGALVAQALTLKGGVDPKAGHSAGPVSRGGTYPTRKGTFLSTDTKFAGLIPTGHSAMVYSSSYVVESLGSGVQWGANNWYSSKPHAWGMTARATSSTQDATAADWARGKLGKPYNYNYYDMGTRSAFYCSQLVWAAFRDTTGIDLNTSAYDVLGLHAIHPMELPSSANSTKVSTFYVK